MTQIRILIPVLARPQNAQRVIQSIAAASSVEHAVTFICSPGDEEQIEACRSTDADVIVVPWEAGKADFAKKINLAYTHYEEPWVFQAADDVSFGTQWDLHVLREAERSGAGVIGTNDMGNPLVRRGNHSTHTMFSRSYIDTYGGTFDGSGVIFSEAYDHQFVDTEFIQTAILRGQFSFARRSIVEHMHPHWGKAQTDSTYEKATRKTEEDKAVYVNRMRRARNTIVRGQTREERHLRRGG